MNDDIIPGTDENGRSFVQIGTRRLFATGRKPYYSRGRLPFVRTGASGAWVFTCLAGTELELFSYVRGATGSPQGVNGTATHADTNLLNDGKQTNHGEMVLLRGLAIEILPTSDAEAVKAAAAELSVRIDRAGTRQDYLGSILDWPAGRGLFGLANSALAIHAIGGSVPLVGAVANGPPNLQSIRELPDPFLWTPQGKGDSSTMSVVLKAERAIVVNSQVTSQTAAAGVHGFTVTADGAYLVDLKVHLVGETFSESADAA